LEEEEFPSSISHHHLHHPFCSFITAVPSPLFKEAKIGVLFLGMAFTSHEEAEIVVIIIICCDLLSFTNPKTKHGFLKRKNFHHHLHHPFCSFITVVPFPFFRMQKLALSLSLSQNFGSLSLRIKPSKVGTSLIIDAESLDGFAVAEKEIKAVHRTRRLWLRAIIVTIFIIFIIVTILLPETFCSRSR
jgi:hypothetical protein